MFGRIVFSRRVLLDSEKRYVKTVHIEVVLTIFVSRPGTRADAKKTHVTSGPKMSWPRSAFARIARRSLAGMAFVIAPYQTCAAGAK